MTTLAALVLVSSLTATAGGSDETPSGSGEKPAVAPTRRSERLRRRRETFEALNILGGIVLEAGAGLAYVATASNVDLALGGRDAGCDASSSKSCGSGTPVVLLVPLSASAMGGLGAVRLAAGRHANLWLSPMFWAGTGVNIAAYVVWGVTSDQTTRNERVAWDTTFMAVAVLGTAMQIWGALIAPPREVESVSVSHALHVAPGCGPTAGGIACGLALAGF